MNLLAVEYSWIADVVLLVALLIGMAIGAARGFVRGICKIGGTLLALVMAFMFCVPLAGYLSDLGAVAWLAGFLKNSDVAYWVMVGVSFIVLTLLTKLAAFLIGLICKSIIKTSKVLAFLDRIFGGALGIAMTLLLVGIVLAIFSFINVPVVTEYIEAGKVTNWLYDWVGGLLKSIL